MSVTLEKQKRERAEGFEQLADVIYEWITLERKTAKEDDWLEYASRPKRRRSVVAP